MKKRSPKLILFLFLSLSVYTLQAQKPLTDFDGNSYSTLIIQGAEWMTGNLDVSHYSNGDLIPQVQDPAKWSALKSGAWCRFDYRDGDHVIRGKLYNGYALLDPRGLPPAGWKVPVSADWYKMDDWSTDTSKGYSTDDTTKLRLFLRNDISTMNCFENSTRNRVTLNHKVSQSALQRNTKGRR